MQLPWDEHFFEIVIPAWQVYLAAEAALTEAVISKDSSRIQKAKYAALREGGATSFYIHHFAEIVMRARPHWMPCGITKVHELREWVEAHCTMLRTQINVPDISLLGDVADALKHAILTQRLNMRDVEANDAVLAAQSGYGHLAFGEGKAGGIDQVLILAKSGTRALSSVLQNTIDAWRKVADLQVPEIGRP